MTSSAGSAPSPLLTKIETPSHERPLRRSGAARPPKGHGLEGDFAGTYPAGAVQDRWRVILNTTPSRVTATVRLHDVRRRGELTIRPANQTEGWTSTLRTIFEGRISTSNMPNKSSDRIELLQGTLDMLILRTLQFGPAHGHEIAKHIQRTTEDVLQVEHGSLYPALHRLERKGWLASKWETAKDRNREFKYYRLTTAGRKQLIVEESTWKQLAGAIARVMWPAKEG